MQHLHVQLHDVPPDVRAAILVATHKLVEKGPRGLVEAGLWIPEISSPESVASMMDYMSDFPGKLVELPDSAELWAHVTPDDIWEVELPLHNDVEGRSDLFLFLRVDRNAHSVEVTDLYAP